MRFFIHILFLGFAISAPALAGKKPPARSTVKMDGQIVSVKRGEQTFENASAMCVKNDTCELKKVFFRKEDLHTPPDPRIVDDNTLRTTRMFAGFVTERIEYLARYVFVQFTRGCMWDSYLNNDDVVRTEFGVVRDILGFSRIQHVIPNWVVDSDDTDPVYGADQSSGNRHYFLQHSPTIPVWIPDRQGKLHGEERPVIPFGYITDMPGPAYYSPIHKTAVNMTLEFKTCLFKLADVPLYTNGIDVDITRAVTCFAWGSNFVFDHTSLEFKNTSGIHLECRRPFSAREKNVHLQQLERVQSK